MVYQNYTTALAETAINELRHNLQGELIQPVDAGYEEHRKIWNGSIDRYPFLIARCATEHDVVQSVRFARDHDLLVAVRGGGHSFPGLSVCDDGMVIDLRLMNRILVDHQNRTVRAQAGALLGELDAETQKYDLAVPAGIVSHTGLAGLTLGGGIGFIMRKFGLTIDNLLSVQLVTADGERVRASDKENSDLFWGVRGGGGNFGIVTEFEFKLNKVGPQVVAGPVMWPMEEASKVFRFYRDWISGAPDELMTIIAERKAPDLPIIPRDLVGRRILTVIACYVGDTSEGERVLKPLKSFGSPVLDACYPKSYLEHQQMFNPSFKHGCWYYVRSCDVDELNEDVIDIATEYGNRISSPISSIALWQMGGAVSRVDDNETAFHGRKAGFTFNINGNTETAVGFEQEREWARDYWTALSPYHTSVYVNFLMEEGEERIRQAYGEVKYKRLKDLKRKYDPNNFFRLNQNISPY